MRARHLSALRIHVIVLILAVTGSCVTNQYSNSKAGTNREEPDSFTLAVLPDTQNYLPTASNGGRLDYVKVFESQTRWILQNHLRENIVFVLHEGDITSENSDLEWGLVNEIFSPLDGIVPYILTPGNHDVPSHAQSPGNPRDTANYNKTFPVDRFQHEPWWGGHMEADPDQRFVLFTAGGTDFMVVTLEWMPNDEMLAWANEVVEAHPDRRVIVLTHSYLDSDETRIGPEDNRASHQASLWTDDTNNGEDIWEEFVRRHKNIFLVLCGHVLSCGRLTSRGDHGNKVHQVLANYQGMENGGNGWLRLMRFEPAADRIVVSAYSPWLDRYSHDESDGFVLELSDAREIESQVH